MTEKTFTVVGTARYPDGTLKLKWTNDLVSRTKILNKGGLRDIKWYELPRPMTKIESLTWFKEHPDVDEVTVELIDFKISDKTKTVTKAAKREALVTNVTNVASTAKTLPEELESPETI